MMPRNSVKNRVLLLALCALLAGVGAVAAKMPVTPAGIKYPPLNWQVPLGKSYRDSLKNGLRVYCAEDHTFPVVSIEGYIRCGTLCDPAGKEGLSQLTAMLMRTGGAKSAPADSLDARCDQLALSISIECSGGEMIFKCTALSEYADTALAILTQMLFNPAFEPEKFKHAQTVFIESIKHRFDNPAPVVDAAFDKIMYPDQSNSRLASVASIKRITRADIAAYHQNYVQTQNIICGISGDFDKKALLARLTEIFPQSRAAAYDSVYAHVKCAAEPRWLFVQRPGTQVSVRLGVPLLRRPDPDYYPVSVMNEILGGAGFTSRLGGKIRSDEGLTYSIHSQAESNYLFPGTFFIQFQTKNQSLSRALALTHEEISRFCEDGVTNRELAMAKTLLIDGLPSNFRTKEDIVQTYSWNEYYGRPDSIFYKYPAAINALTKDDVLRVARKYLAQKQFWCVAVGDTAANSPLNLCAQNKAFGCKTMVVIPADSIEALP